MIVKVEMQGAFVRVHSKDGTVDMTTSATAGLRARMAGRREAFFEATTETGGGTKDWGQGAISYANPSEIVELGENVEAGRW